MHEMRAVSTWVCGVLQDDLCLLAEHPVSTWDLTLSFRQLLSVRENPWRGTIPVWLWRPGAGEWPGSRWCDAYVAPCHGDETGDS